MNLISIEMFETIIFFAFQKTTLDKLEHDLKEVISNKEALNKNFLELMELKHVLYNGPFFFEQVNSYNSDICKRILIKLNVVVECFRICLSLK